MIKTLLFAFLICSVALASPVPDEVARSLDLDSLELLLCLLRRRSSEEKEEV